MPPALASLDDPHGWLLRGWIEGGVADGTGRSFTPTPTGIVDAGDLLGLGRGANGLRLCFAEQALDLPAQEDEYTYIVKVVRDPNRSCVVARSEDTLYFREYEERPYDTLGARILADIRAHNANFTAWRKKGGQLAYGERQGIPEVRGVACAAALSNFLDRQYKAGHRLEVGPDEGWWNQRMDAKVLGKQIGLGKGAEVFTLTRPPSEADKPENKPYVQRLKWAGMGMIVSGLISGSWCFGMVGYLFYRWFHLGFASIFTAHTQIASMVLTLIMACIQIWAGVQVRNFRSAFYVQMAAVFALMPCAGPCCIPAFPFSLALLYLMRDSRMEAIFED